MKFGVKVPVEFWKVIAFIHDETGELCATGYKMSQKDHLPEEEFVFDEFDTAQLPIRKIERLTGLSFGDLSKHDPLNDDNESFEGSVLMPNSFKGKVFGFNFSKVSKIRFLLQMPFNKSRRNIGAVDGKKSSNERINVGLGSVVIICQIEGVADLPYKLLALCFESLVNL